MHGVKPVGLHSALAAFKHDTLKVTAHFSSHENRTTEQREKTYEASQPINRGMHTS